MRSPTPPDSCQVPLVLRVPYWSKFWMPPTVLTYSSKSSGILVLMLMVAPMELPA